MAPSMFTMLLLDERRWGAKEPTSLESCHVSLSKSLQVQSKPPSIDPCSTPQSSCEHPFEATGRCSTRSHFGWKAMSCGPDSVEPLHP
jgi:hypothetical protein